MAVLLNPGVCRKTMIIQNELKLERSAVNSDGECCEANRQQQDRTRRESALPCRLRLKQRSLLPLTWAGNFYGQSAIREAKIVSQSQLLIP